MSADSMRATTFLLGGSAHILYPTTSFELITQYLFVQTPRMNLLVLMASFLGGMRRWLRTSAL